MGRKVKQVFVPEQVPPLHVSFSVQAFPSSHEPVTLV